MSYKDEFLTIYKSTIKREGADKLLDWLEKSDFFAAPCSTKFHCAYEGGLVEHSVNVYNRLLSLVKKEYGEEWQKKYSHETVTICGLLHDVCKVHYYDTDFRNAKIDGVWQQVPYYTRREILPYGHGEKSVFILQNFIRLSTEEALAINWHMGGFDDRAKSGSFSISDAYAKYKLCPLMHTADLLATYIDEERL